MPSSQLLTTSQPAATGGEHPARCGQLARPRRVDAVVADRLGGRAGRTAPRRALIEVPSCQPFR
eukprot:358401-Chlamydomonas_euryale.AAC.3